MNPSLFATTHVVPLTLDVPYRSHQVAGPELVRVKGLRGPGGKVDAHRPREPR